MRDAAAQRRARCAVRARVRCAHMYCRYLRCSFLETPSALHLASLTSSPAVDANPVGKPIAAIAAISASASSTSSAAAALALVASDAAGVAAGGGGWPAGTPFMPDGAIPAGSGMPGGGGAPSVGGPRGGGAPSVGGPGGGRRPSAAGGIASSSSSSSPRSGTLERSRSLLWLRAERSPRSPRRSRSRSRSLSLSLSLSLSRSRSLRLSRSRSRSRSSALGTAQRH